MKFTPPFPAWALFLGIGLTPFVHAASSEEEIAAAIARLQAEGYTVLPPNAETEAQIAPPQVKSLTIAEIEAEIDYWPATVELKETISFSGGQSVRRGSMLDVQKIAGGQLEVTSGDLFFTIEPELTDLLARAQAIASGHGNYAGRLPNRLAGRADIPLDGSLRKATAEDLAGADVYLLYLGSPACGWCKRFLPTLESSIKELQRAHPGKLKYVHASMRIPYQDYRAYMQALSPDAGLPPGDRLFVDALMAKLNVESISIPQPAVLLMNASGRVLAHASREDRNLGPLEKLLEKDLPKMLREPASIRPRWAQGS